MTLVLSFDKKATMGHGASVKKPLLTVRADRKAATKNSRMIRTLWRARLLLIILVFHCKGVFSFAPTNIGHVCRSQQRQQPINRDRQLQKNGGVHGRQIRDALTRREYSWSLSLVPASLIAPSDDWGNWMVLLGNAALAQILGKTTTIGRLLGPPVTAMALTFGLATLHVLPAGGTVAASSMQQLTLQLATPLVLLGADLRNATSRCGPLLKSFMMASMATVVACLIGWNAVGGSLTTALGRDGLVIAAALMAKNIGGGLNYMAVCSSLDASPTAIAAGLCVDNIFALLYFPVTSYLASRYDDPAVNEPKTDDETLIMTTNNNQQTKSWTAQDFSVERITNVLFGSAALLWAGRFIGGKTGALPLTTLLTVLLAGQLAPYKWVMSWQPAAQVLGTVALYVFFSTAGAPGVAVADSVRASVIPLSTFLLLLYGIHGLILTIIHKVCKGRQATAVPRLLCASSAAIGGPATAVALAQAAQWESLQVPSLLVGNLGYAMATFLGLGYHALFLK